MPITRTVNAGTFLSRWIRGEEKAALYLNFESREAFRLWADRNKVRKVKDGKSWVFDRQELDQIMDDKMTREEKEREARNIVEITKQQKLDRFIASLKQGKKEKRKQRKRSAVASQG